MSNPAVRPDSRVRPPLDMLTSGAPMVPAPGTPPTAAEARLPRPWPISTRLESWRVRVSASVTTQVFSVSIESSTASVSAGMITLAISLPPSAPNACQRPAIASVKPSSETLRLPTTSAFPARSSSERSASPSAKYDSTPAARPRIAAGTALVTLGAASITATVITPTTIPCHCQTDGVRSESQRDPPFGAPRNFGTWLRMMMRPTPLR